MTRTLKDIQQHTLVRIVDDNEDLRETCEMMLTYAGWQVRTYAGAWSFLMDDAPSVPGCLILDISMPDMTGTELQMEMRRRRYSLPIIILTGHANVDLAVTTLKAGAAEFFEKPVDEDRLMKAIAKLCRESLAKSCGELTGRDLEKAFDLLTERERNTGTYDPRRLFSTDCRTFGLERPHHLCAPERHLPKARNKKSVEYFARRSR